MKVKAYEWENSVEVEVKEISDSDLETGFLWWSTSNWNDVGVARHNGKWIQDYVSVKVYYPNDYHYEVSIIDYETDEVKERHCFSSGKGCRPEVVACELLKMYQ